MNITKAQIQGPRPYQEDRIVVHENIDGSVLLAVFDGHGGLLCAERASNSIISLYNSPKDGETVYYKTIEYLFKELNDITKDYDAGSTASIVLIDKFFTSATVGILGDSPVYIKTADGFFLSEEHNVRTNLKEKEALIARGGAVTWDGNYAYDPNDYSLNRGGGLQMTRALGDNHLDKILLREPSISTVPLTDDSVILLASDGLFDPGHTDGGEGFRTVQDLLSYSETGAEQLIENKRHSGSGLQDNVSAIVVRK